MRVRVEYDSIPIRHIAVECPECGKWFDGREITDDPIIYREDIWDVNYVCPVCHTIFSGNDRYIDVNEWEYPEIYEGCLKKKVTWEKYDE